MLCKLTLCHRADLPLLIKDNRSRTAGSLIERKNVFFHIFHFKVQSEKRGKRSKYYFHAYIFYKFNDFINKKQRAADKTATTLYIKTTIDTTMASLVRDKPPEPCPG